MVRGSSEPVVPVREMPVVPVPVAAFPAFVGPPLPSSPPRVDVGLEELQASAKVMLRQPRLRTRLRLARRGELIMG